MILSNIFAFVQSNMSKFFVLIIPAGLFTYTLQEYQTIQMLFIVLFVDIFLGIALAIKFKRFSSHRMGACIPRMIGYMVTIILLTVIVRMLSETSFLFYYTLSVFIFREISSHIENLSLLGIKIPEKIMSFVNDRYKNKEEARELWNEKNKNFF